VFMRYLIGVLEIFDLSPRDIGWRSWTYLGVSYLYLVGALKIFDGCPRDI